MGKWGQKPQGKIKTKLEKRQTLRRERGANSTKDNVSFFGRRARRGSIIGRQTEKRVETLLGKKLADGELTSFRRFPPNSTEDNEGKDFEVSRGEITASFGITISPQSHQEHCLMHPDIPSIIIPPNMKDETIWWRSFRRLGHKARAFPFILECTIIKKFLKKV